LENIMTDKAIAVGIYHEARKRTLDEFRADGFVPEDSPEEMGALVYRTANECTEEEFVNFVLNGDMPECELTEDDLDNVAGGAQARRRGPSTEHTYFNLTVACCAQ
jgi:hypothetical protein